MKNFALGCGTVVVLIVAAFAYLFLSLDFDLAEGERENCDEAVNTSSGFDVSRLETGHSINITNGVRTVTINYPGDFNRPAFSCVLLEGEVQSITRSETVVPTEPEAEEDVEA